MQPETPISTDVVLIGGGHTHAIVLRKLGMVRLPGVRLTLITNLVDTPYSGMLPCHVSGRYSFDESHIDLRPLTRFANCRLYMDRAIGLDMERREVICANHPPVSFDVLSIDTGSTPATVKVPGAEEYTIPAKPVPELLRQWHQLLQEVRENPTRSLTIGMVGGGVGGVELTLNMQERLYRLLEELGQPTHRATFHMFHRGDELASGRNRWTRRRLQKIFRERGIQLHLNEAVTQLDQPDPHGSILVSGESGVVVECDRVFWVTSASAPQWLQGSGLSLDDKGFIQTRDTLQTFSHPHVFAAGDVATMVNHPRPKAGVFAVRQGKPLYDNLLRLLQGKPLKPFHPQKQFLTLIDIGYGRTIASRGPFSLESSLFRRWKNHIDQKFMDLFREFPSMEEMNPKIVKLPNISPASLTHPYPSQEITHPYPSQEITHPYPSQEGTAIPQNSTPSHPTTTPPTSPTSPTLPCTGCGSKVGSNALSLAIQRVREDFPNFGATTDDLLIGLDSPDDAAVVRVPEGQVMVHTVDFFTAMVDDPFVFAQICLKHCLSDLYAMGAKPHSVLAIVQVPYATPEKQADTLYPLLVGIQKGLLSTGAPLVGGHTTVASQLGLGFACNGAAYPDRLLRKGGMQPGDVLILTQPIGTGTLFAADMRRLAKGRWIESAIRHMLQSNQQAGAVFQAQQATACTDVTGFGLAGHLLEMVRASRVSVDLDLTHLPILYGARETLAQGIVSSLQPQNLQAAKAIANAEEYERHPDYPLLYDPQTAGGLLAAVPADKVEDCLHQLQEKGYYSSTVIGQVVPGEDLAQPIRIKKW
jgi:selenide,water dikinase